MRAISKIATLAILVAVLAACNSSAKDNKGDLTDKRNKVQKLKAERSKLDTEIKTLEEQIAKADPGSAFAICSSSDLISVSSFDLSAFSF